MKDGKLEIKLKSALKRDFKGKTDFHDLTIIANFANGIWRPDGIAYAYTYNSRLNHPKIKWLKATNEILQAEIVVDIEPDPWVAGGHFEAFVSLCKTAENEFTGDYIGTFYSNPVKGSAIANFAEKRVVGCKIASQKPRILEKFLEQGSKSKLYDFSGAGLKKPIVMENLPVFKVEDFGAKPNSGSEARDAVQEAVDAATAAGGGIIIFPAGEFDFSVEEKKPPVFIESSNVIIQGAGSGLDGTILVNHRYSETIDPSKIWLAGLSPGFFLAAPDAKKNYLKVDSPELKHICEIRKAERGSRKIEVRIDDQTCLKALTTSSLKTFLLRYLENSEGTLAKSLVFDVCQPAKNYLGAGKPLVGQIFELVSCSEKNIEIDFAVHWDYRDEWQGEICELRTIENVLIKDLRLRSCWNHFFVHHKNAEHDNGWDHIKFAQIKNSAVQNVVHESTTTAVFLHNCKNCLVENNFVVGNPGHNGFICEGFSTDNLFLRCHAGRQMHGFNLAGTPSGNVFLFCELDEPGGIDLHGGVCLDNLFDCLLGGVNAGGGSENAVPPRHSAGFVMWNWQMGRYHPYNPSKYCDKAMDFAEMPGFIAVGVRGRYGDMPFYVVPTGNTCGELFSDIAWIESPCQKVFPESLYLFQKKKK